LDRSRVIEEADRPQEASKGLRRGLRAHAGDDELDQFLLGRHFEVDLFDAGEAVGGNDAAEVSSARRPDLSP
jgi:hypothetical protein